jgi:hypothetical protein
VCVHGIIEQLGQVMEEASFCKVVKHPDIKKMQFLSSKGLPGIWNHTAADPVLPI